MHNACKVVSRASSPTPTAMHPRNFDACKLQPGCLAIYCTQMNSKASHATWCVSKSQRNSRNMKSLMRSLRKKKKSRPDCLLERQMTNGGIRSTLLTRWSKCLCFVINKSIIKRWSFYNSLDSNNFGLFY